MNLISELSCGRDGVEGLAVQLVDCWICEDAGVFDWVMVPVRLVISDVPVWMVVLLRLVRLVLPV